MGLFGGLGRTLKGIDWDRVSTGLSAAGASAHGDHGTAAQIRSLSQKQRTDRAEQEAKAQAAQAAVAALVRQGIPEEDAKVLVQSGAADTVLSGRYGQQADSEFVRTLKMAGIDPASPEAQQLARQRATTMASPAPQMIGSPETGYRWVTPPPMTSAGWPQPGEARPPAQSGGPPTVSDEAGYNALPPGTQYRDPQGTIRTKGGGGGNATGGFRSGGPSFPF